MEYYWHTYIQLTTILLRLLPSRPVTFGARHHSINHLSTLRLIEFVQRSSQSSTAVSPAQLEFEALEYHRLSQRHTGLHSNSQDV